VTIPTLPVLAAARQASRQMADRDTPFIRDEWYVAAFADEVGRTLLKRTLLDRRVVLYRTEQGDAVALADRCAHRSYPLSSGYLEGDTLVCGYHGFRYDAAGDCIEVPSTAKCPRSIGVRRYPLVERGGLVWIWMGEPQGACAAPLPDLPFLADPHWVRSQGYFHLRGNYVSLHENLLDLTHLSYIHAKSFGTPDYARAPFKTEVDGGHIVIRRDVVPTRLPPVWGEPTGLAGIDTAARIATSEFMTPGAHQVGVRFYDSSLAAGNRAEFEIRTAHLPTPETHGTTHYFIVHGRDFATADAHLTTRMHDQLFAAFAEDVDAMALLEETLEATPADEMYEISVASDAPSVEMRRYLKRRALSQHDCADSPDRRASDRAMARPAGA